MRTRLHLGVLLAALTTGALAPAAEAETRHASASSTATSGACTIATPCALSYAVSGAAAGDEVVVAPGDYVLRASLIPGAIHIRGVAGQPRPRLVGAANLTQTTVSMKDGGSLRHLSIEATSSSSDALTLRDAVAEGLVLAAAGGDGAKIMAAPSTTILRDSVVRLTSTSSSSAALKLRDGSGGDPGSLALVNVTAIAVAGQASAILCENTISASSVVNVIARGAVADLDLSKGPACSVSTSNFRPFMSPGAPTGSGNSGADPAFADAPNGDFRPLAGSPAVDAGAAHAHLGTGDPDGRARTLGSAPDVGAYEQDPGDPPTVEDEPAPAFPPPPAAAFAPDPAVVDPARAETTTPGTTTLADAIAEPAPTGLPVTPDPLAAPKLGRVVVASGDGAVYVRVPGSSRAVALDAAVSVPVGSIFDATRGTVTLRTAVDRVGTTQSGTFSGGKFRVGQNRFTGGMVDIALHGGRFAACPRAATTLRARTAGRRKAVRRLWGRDAGGRFRTRGRTSVATVRGTVWLTEDRCEGTLTRVVEGAVSVRDLRRGGRSVLVRAGAQRLVRTARR